VGPDIWPQLRAEYVLTRAGSVVKQAQAQTAIPLHLAYTAYPAVQPPETRTAVASNAGMRI